MGRKNATRRGEKSPWTYFSLCLTAMCRMPGAEGRARVPLWVWTWHWGKGKRLRDISGRGSYPLVPKCYKAQFSEATRIGPNITTKAKRPGIV